MKILDGHNLIGAARELGITLEMPDKEERLLRLLAAFRSRRRSTEILLVVFDGHYGTLLRGPRASSRGGIAVEWAVGESADALILRRVRNAARPKELEVVTSDREVLRAAGSHGARTVRSPQFLEQVRSALRDGSGAEKPEVSAPEEIDEWLARFGGV